MKKKMNKQEEDWMKIFTACLMWSGTPFILPSSSLESAVLKGPRTSLWYACRSEHPTSPRSHPNER